MATANTLSRGRRFAVSEVSSGITGSYVYTPPVATPADPYWANVVALLGFNDGQMVDEGPNAFSVTNNWGTISSSAGKFDGYLNKRTTDGSMVVVGTPAQRGAFSITASVDYTIEFWLKSENDTYTIDLFNCYFSQSFAFVGPNNTATRLFYSGPTTDLYWCLNGGTYSNFSVIGKNYSDGNWHHIAVVRYGTAAANNKIYIDGVSCTGTLSSNAGFTQCGNLTIGCNNAATAYDDTLINCSMDEFRWTNGVARYTANFTPPSASFPRHG